jgi:hypothetical protein
MKTKLMPSGVYLQKVIAHVLNSSLTKQIAQVKRHYFWTNKLLYVAPESLTKRKMSLKM